jgi:hypothetical protein
MTEEQKNIVLLGSRYETMNKYIDLSNDDGTIAKGIAEAMQEYAERYHIAQTKKLHQPTVSGAVCPHYHQKWYGEPHNAIRKCETCGEILNRQTER